jgi:hypothetical protein
LISENAGIPRNCCNGIPIYGRYSSICITYIRSERRRRFHIDVSFAYLIIQLPPPSPLLLTRNLHLTMNVCLYSHSSCILIIIFLFPFLLEWFYRVFICTTDWAKFPDSSSRQSEGTSAGLCLEGFVKCGALTSLNVIYWYLYI